MQTQRPLISYLVFIVSTFMLLIGCDIQVVPADVPDSGGNIAIEEEAAQPDEEIFEVQQESVNEEGSTSATEDGNGEYEVEVQIINEDDESSSGSEESVTEGESEDGQARSLDDAETASEDGSILREGEHVIYVGDQAILDAFADGRSDVLVEGSAIVERTLPDDNEGSRHQRFILRLEEGHTVLVAHNIDISPKIPLQKGDWVDFRGEYEWTEQGGVVHWTHHDPKGKHLDGWIFHDGEFYD